MIVEVHGNLEGAIRTLKRKLAADGIDRETKINQIPKRSSRRRFKAFLAERRKRRDQAKRKWGR